MISYHHDITGRHGISRFLSRIHQKHKVYHFYPFIKARNEKINELQAITFRDLSATSAETGLAPPKRAKRQKKIQKFLKFFQIIFGVEKSKVANRLKRIFPKFCADRSHVRGVNGLWKFASARFVKRK